ncbi:MAG TPA: porin [Caulobacteraceae bacterium]|nr:porin [Caulobacteraceae bacterium]
MNRFAHRAVLLASCSAVAFTSLVTAAQATPADDAARDARIARLEAAVAALQGVAAENQQLQQQNAELKGEVDQLNAQVTDLKATTITQLSDVRTAEDKQPTLTFPGGRPSFASADGKFTVSVRGQLQLDTAAYFQDAAGPITTDLRRDGPALGSSSTNVDAAHARHLKDGTLWRRARVGFEGTAYGDWDYRMLFDFGGSGVENAGQVYEAWAQYSGLKPFRLRAGAWSQPIGLEDQMSTNAQLFLERPGMADVARGLAAGDTRIGAGAFGYDNVWFLSADVTGRTIGAINTGTVITASSVPFSGNLGTPQTYSDQLGFVGRAVATPLHGDDWRLNIGVHGSYEKPGNTSGPDATGVVAVKAFSVRLRDTAELRVDGTQFIDTGSIPAHDAGTIGGEFAVQKGPLFAEAEYETIFVSRSDGLPSPSFSGWYVEGAWVPTGESRAYNASTAAFDGPPVAHPFSLKNGGWGAWELAARYSDADLNFRAGLPGAAPAADAIRGGDQRVWAIGLNWYPNPVFHFMLDFDHVDISRLSPSGANFLTPEGAQIGQSYNVVALRSQAAF